MTAQTVSKAVATRDQGPVRLMWSRRSHFRAVLPASVDVEAFLGTAAGALYASQAAARPGALTLMECATVNPDSLEIALMRCAALGHLPGTDEFYLTPRKEKGRPKVLGIEGYRGIVERMYRSGAVAKVVVREVCENDAFRYIEGEDEVPRHDFSGGATTGAQFFGAAGQRGAMVGVYAYARLTTGAVSRIVLLSRDDVLAARDSGGYREDDPFTPWNRLDAGKDHPEFKGRSMWWKTAARRLEPWVPTSREYRAEMLRASAAAASRPQPPPELPPAGDPEPDIVDAELADPVPEASAQEVNDQFARLGFTVDDQADVLAIGATLAGRRKGRPRDIDELAALTGAELGRVRDALAACESRDDVIALLARISGNGNGDADGQ